MKKLKALLQKNGFNTEFGQTIGHDVLTFDAWGSTIYVESSVPRYRVVIFLPNRQTCNVCYFTKNEDVLNIFNKVKEISNEL